MFKNTLLAAFFAVLFAGSANAATYVVSLDFSGTPSVVGVTLSDEVLSGNVALSSAILTGVSGVTTETTSSHKAPLGLGDGQEYLYVGASVLDPPTVSSATFSFNSTQTKSFGLTWGTVDSYNDLTLVAANNKVFSVSGADLLALLGFSGYSLPNSELQVDVFFSVVKGSQIKSVLLTSLTANAFEIANASTSLVPLPPAALLFLSGLVLLAGFAAYRNKAYGRI